MGFVLKKKFKGMNEEYKMPPRARKNVAPSKEPVIADEPVIFFLKVSKEVQNAEKKDAANLPEPIKTVEYSEILKQENTQRQFDAGIIHEIIAKIHQQSEYPPGSACFWCCHTFSWRSCVIPTHYDVYTNQYNAEGHFCSPECALAWVYSDHTLTNSQRWLRHSLIQTMYRSLYPQNTAVHPAPDKRVLRLFGGTLSIEQYRRYIKEDSAPLQLAMPPIRLYMPSINTQASTRDIKSYVALSNETVTKASQQLRLKRSKPIHSTAHTLDKCMGFNAKQ